MRIMKGDKIVARQCKKDGEIMPVFRAEPWTDYMDLPIALFGFGNREVNIEQFIYWVTDRCFPENRVDADDLLRELGMRRYDAWEIVQKTNARLIGIDDFWVDFKRN